MILRHLFHQVDFRHFQRKSCRALLSLGPILSNIDPVGLYTKIVSVRTYGRHTETKIFFSRTLQFFFKYFLFHIRFIQQPDLFFLPGQVAVDLPDDLSEFFHKPLSQRNDLLPVRNQLHIPHIQCLRQSRLKTDVF